MPPNKTLFPIAVLVAVVALVFWATTRNSSNAPSFAANGAGADGGGYQALVDAQTAQNKRLDRLETMIGRIAARDGVSQATASQEQQGPDLDRMTVAEKQSMQENRRRTTEAAFVAEPVSAGWSARNEKTITDAFSADTLAEDNAPKPRLHDAQCRSRTCRIEVVYDNDDDAQIGQVFLLSHIGGTLGRSTPFQRTLPDGSVQIIMYSSANPPRPPGGGHDGHR